MMFFFEKQLKPKYWFFFLITSGNDILNEPDFNFQTESNINLKSAGHSRTRFVYLITNSQHFIIIAGDRANFCI